MFFIIFNLKFTYSKLYQNIDINSVSNIANFALEIRNISNKIVKDVLNNDEIIYEFSVQNFSKNISSEVKSKYNIILELSQKNPPLIIELYRVKNKQEEKVELNNFITKTPEIFNVGDKTVNYKIRVYYDKNNKNILKDGFNIKMKVEDVQEEE